ncbi:hypothetical protein SAMN04489724_4009 [Algoriphagus locisalis]|uniref:Outer membrane protein beta-barrel domain-containing protein n=1 Tax=Algoriphagus locisalis TaxID=305507 RepID=A0A1I7DFJ1_9BACT|nr:hypothetical protein [Algoriphagus locisalis]SFU10491.1 hypothetical protein SAMN04489724_4009 [Algoriphagus locisalis]
MRLFYEKLTFSILFLFLLGFSPAYAQNSFGLEFGHNWRSISGGAFDYDSIRISTISGGDTGEPFGGIFYEYQIGKRISLHNKLNYGSRFIGYAVYNNFADCQFCPVRKIATVGVGSLAFEILPQVTILSYSNFKLNIFGGVNSTFNFVKNEADLYFQNQPGVSSVFNSLDSVVDPITFSFAYGASLEIWRIMLWAKVNPPASFTNSIEINDQEYDFDNSWGFVSFSLGYKFFSLKRRHY